MGPCTEPSALPVPSLMLWDDDISGLVADFPSLLFEALVSKTDPLDIVSTTPLGSLALA